MSGRYLTNLADVCRGAGLAVVEVGGGPSVVGPDWQWRARSSGGFASGRPSHVMIHHTASGAGSDGWPDVNYCTFSSDNRPVCNLYLARTGWVWVCAAGATNTNGKGGPIDNVAQDQMNTSALGIEAGNDGVGESWPEPMQQAYVRLVRALIGAYAIPVGHCRSHREWAPDRKKDPAGGSRWAPPGGGGSTWNEDGFRGDVATGWPGGHLAPEPEEDDVPLIRYTDEGGAAYVSDTLQIRWLTPTGDRELADHGKPIAGGQVTRQAVKDGNYGVPLGPMPG